MPIDWTPFVEFIRKDRSFALTTHIRPDGDGLGSMLALAGPLARLGKEVTLFIGGDLPARYQFMDLGRKFERFDPHQASQRPPPDAVIVLDTGTWNQLGEFGPYLKSFAGSKAVIDHHKTQDDLGALCLVDIEAEATGRLVFEAIQALGAPLPQEAAQALFVALSMDTGWFRHANTTSASFALASELVRAGARPDLLYDQLFENSTLARLKLMGLVLDRLQVTNAGRVAYTEIRRGDYALTGAMPQDSEDLVNLTRSITGVEVGLFFMEQPKGGVKVSFRSRAHVDVARVAEHFGGGGHRLAAGAVLEVPLDEARGRVLDRVAIALEASP